MNAEVAERVELAEIPVDHDRRCHLYPAEPPEENLPLCGDESGRGDYCPVGPLDGAECCGERHRCFQCEAMR